MFQLLFSALCLSCQVPLTLTWEDNWLTIHDPRLPGKALRIHYLEAYCRDHSTDADWDKHTVIGHQTQIVWRSADSTQLKLRCTLADGLIVDHHISAGTDEITFQLTVHNPTNRRSVAHWAQPCVRLGRFTGVEANDSQFDERFLKKCFIFVEGRLQRMPVAPWATEGRYIPGQVWRPKHVPATDVNPRPVSNVTPSNGLIGCFNGDETLIYATAWEPYQELFQGVARCLHADFRLGGIPAGATARVRGKIYLVSNDIAGLLKRYERDFPEHLPK